ncbi:rCG41081 [Rattus norvegicus]|uniref:RCG41081 n=1 Tax=Rattus norvegicus TaxID=10116 RepID=A6K2B9_RAT|nr:rCG41081 [Rattus norvegicus]
MKLSDPERRLNGLQTSPCKLKDLSSIPTTRRNQQYICTISPCLQGGRRQRVENFPEIQRPVFLEFTVPQKKQLKPG